jgi:NAD-dependent deacetylase
MGKLVVLTGAGVSKESGLGTFRDAGGLWEQYPIEKVATYDAWKSNPELVNQFYNLRRKQMMGAVPNSAHTDLKDLENYYDVQIITQNIDNLHERAGSSSVLHLHGRLDEARSEHNEDEVYKLTNWELKIGMVCSKGNQLRPNVVWFGEAVPNMEKALMLVKQADILVIIGTSLQVYPAASLIEYAPKSSPIYIIDPEIPNYPKHIPNPTTVIPNIATVGLKKLKVALQTPTNIK